MKNDVIPFLDLKTPHRELESELTAIFQTALSTAGFIGGPMVEQFENEFAEFCGTKYCVGVGSGTDALRFALMAAGVKQNDIVITVPNTFIATTEAISQAGAIIDFVDVREVDRCMDPAALREYLETQCNVDEDGRARHKLKGHPVTAVIPVHLYGYPAGMDPILEIAEKYSLEVIEDACQAHGTEYFSEKEQVWKKAGSIGVAAAFSFYPGKNLGACGEAGAVTTSDHVIAKKIRMIRDHGQAQKYYHDLEGYNGRLDAIQAGILSIKLKYLNEWNQARRQIASLYTTGLKEFQGTVTPPVQGNNARPVYHLYVIDTQEREALRAYLSEHEVSTGLHYPIPLHLQNCYKQMNYGLGTYSVSEALSERILSLPMGPTVTEAQAQRVLELIAEFSERVSKVALAL